MNGPDMAHVEQRLAAVISEQRQLVKESFKNGEFTLDNCGAG